MELANYNLKFKANHLFWLIFCAIFYFGIFFPYIKVTPFPIDTQPTALVASIFLFFLVKEKKPPLVLAMLLIPFIFALALGALDNFAFAAIRSILNYASIFFVPYATYIVLKKNNGFPQKYLIIIILIWLFVAFIQTYISSSFLSFLLPRMNTGFQGRGVVSLAPEPSHFGIQCLMFFILSYLNKPKDKLGLLLPMIGIGFFAKSSFSLFIVAIFILNYLVIYFSFKSLFVTLFLFFAGYYYIEFFQRGSRLFVLAHFFIKNPLGLFFLDLSATTRFLNIYFALRGFVENYFLPRGFILNWQPYIESSFHVFLDLFTKHTTFPLVMIYAIQKDIADDPRIFGGLSPALFELGFIGLFIPLAIIIIMYNFSKGNFRKFCYLSLVAITLSLVIPLSTTLFSFILGFCLYKSTLKETICLK